MSKTDSPILPSSGVSRRDFFTTAAGVGAALMIVPRRVLGRGFQAPSDTVNVAVVGINGMGAVNARAVMSQNIVAICDCDYGLLDGKLAEWTRRRSAGRAEARRRRNARRRCRTSARRRHSSPRTRGGRSTDEHANLQRFVERADAAAPEAPRLPGDAREAERHRRRHRRHARSHARDHRVGRDGRRQTRVRAEAALLVGARGAAPGEEGGGHQGRDADGQPAALAGRASGASSNTSWAARSATSREVHVWTNRPWGFWPQGIPRPAPAAGEPRVGLGQGAAWSSGSRRR